MHWCRLARLIATFNFEVLYDQPYLFKDIGQERMAMGKPTYLEINLFRSMKKLDLK